MLNLRHTQHHDRKQTSDCLCLQDALFNSLLDEPYLSLQLAGKPSPQVTRHTSSHRLAARGVMSPTCSNSPLCFSSWQTTKEASLTRTSFPPTASPPWTSRTSSSLTTRTTAVAGRDGTTCPTSSSPVRCFTSVAHFTPIGNRLIACFCPRPPHRRLAARPVQRDRQRAVPRPRLRDGPVLPGRPAQDGPAGAGHAGR